MTKTFAVPGNSFSTDSEGNPWQNTIGALHVYVAVLWECESVICITGVQGRLCGGGQVWART